MRQLLSCLVIAVIAAIIMNSVAMAANDHDHQTYCADAFDDSSHEAMAVHTHVHEYNGLIAQQEMPDHDHETCMQHACPALSAEAVTLDELAGGFLAKVIWPEQPLLALGRADGLKRPPKS